MTPAPVAGTEFDPLIAMRRGSAPPPGDRSPGASHRRIVAERLRGAGYPVQTGIAETGVDGRHVPASLTPPLRQRSPGRRGLCGMPVPFNHILSAGDGRTTRGP